MRAIWSSYWKVGGINQICFFKYQVCAYSNVQNHAKSAARFVVLTVRKSASRYVEDSVYLPTTTNMNSRWGRVGSGGQLRYRFSPRLMGLWMGVVSLFFFCRYESVQVVSRRNGFRVLLLLLSLSSSLSYLLVELSPSLLLSYRLDALRFLSYI